MNADLLVFLAQSTVTLFGFITVFFIFRYQRIDTYIDNRRPVLRALLKKRIRKSPEILRRIELLGRADPVSDMAFFRSVSKDDETVLFYVREILKLSEGRVEIKQRGLLTILYLGLTSFLLWLARFGLHFGAGYLTGFTGLISGVILVGFILFSLGIFLTLTFLYQAFGQKSTGSAS